MNAGGTEIVPWKFVYSDLADAKDGDCSHMHFSNRSKEDGWILPEGAIKRNKKNKMQKTK